MNLRTPALVVLSLILVAGCGGDNDNTKDQADSTPSAPQATSTTAKPGPKATTAKPGVTTSSAPSSAGPTTTQPGSTPAPAQPAATHTAPGSYTYDTEGNLTAGGQTHDASGTQTLKVERPSGDRQRSSLTSEGGGGGTQQDVLHRANGTYLVSLKINAGGYEKEFRPSQPVLGVPKPATAGRSWSWTMTSTDGKTRAAYSGKLTRKEVLRIGDHRVETWVIESQLKLSGDIDYTDNRKTNYDPSRLLQVKTHSLTKGTFSGVPFTGDTVSTMRSVKPS